MSTTRFSGVSRADAQRPRGSERAFATIAVCSLALSACDRSASVAPPPPAPPQVVVCMVAQRDVPIMGEWLGTTDGQVNAEVRSRVQGYIQSREYAEGTLVKTGDLLYQVDPRPFQAELAQAKADLAKSEANYGRTTLDIARLAPLAPSGAVSQQDVDNAHQDNEANRAAVQAAKANVEQAELNLSYTRIVSPIDGIAGISQAQVGDLVGGSTGPVLTTISTLDPIRVYFPISEQEYIKIAETINRVDTAKSGTPTVRPVPMNLILANGSQYEHTGQVDVVNRQVDPTTGTIKIAAKFPNPGNLLRPGQYAKVRAVTATKEGALLVPQRCVTELQGMRQVAVVGADNKVSIRAVTTAERIGSDWIISDGLKPGERVILEGLQKVREGMIVDAKLAEPGAKPQPSPASSGAAAPAPKAK